jgi:hypothetical protein
MSRRISQVLDVLEEIRMRQPMLARIRIAAIHAVASRLGRKPATIADKTVRQLFPHVANTAALDAYVALWFGGDSSIPACPGLPKPPVDPEKKVHGAATPRSHGTNPHFTGERPYGAHIHASPNHAVECLNGFSLASHDESTASSATKKWTCASESQLSLYAQFWK